MILTSTSLKVYPLIVSQNNQFAQAFVAQDSNMETAVENFFRFIALCINIAGLYQGAYPNYLYFLPHPIPFTHLSY